MNKKLLWSALAVLVLVGGATALFMRPAPLVTVTVTEAPLAQSLVFSGRVASVLRVELGSTVTGRVVQVMVREGDRARAGDVLARLDSEEVSAQLAQAQTALQSARARLEGQRELAQPTSQAALAQAQANLDAALTEEKRSRDLLSKGFVSQAKLDDSIRAVQVARAQVDSARAGARVNSKSGNEALQAQLRVREAEAAVTLAQARLQQTRILAPAAGRVVTRSVEPGQIVQPGKVLFQFAADGAVQLIGLADEKFLNQLRRGQSARVVVDAFPAQAFDAQLQSIAPTVDAQRGTVEVKFLVTKPPEFLREDMTLSLQVQVGQKDRAKTLPSAAVIGAGNEGIVRIIRDGHVADTPVKLGLRTLQNVEILEGLKAGDVVIAAPLEAATGRRARATTAP